MVAFDTLKASQRLRKAGFPEDQSVALRKDFANEMAALRKDFASERELLRKEISLRIALGFTGATTLILAAIGAATGIIVALT